jgi:hypothetical protein
MKELETLIANVLDSRSKLYKMGAWCALAIILIYLSEMVIMIVYGPIFSKSVPELFEIFHQRRWIALLQATSLDILAVLFRIPLMIALFLALIKISKSFILLILSMVVGFIGVAVYFSFNSIFSMLHLSDLYYATTDEILKQQFLSAGYAFLASFNASGIQPFLAYTFWGVWGALTCIVMMKSPDFNRGIAIVGLIGFILEQGPPVGICPEWFLKIDPILIGLGGILIIIWYAMVIVKLLKLAKA